jgi:uncharacterized membrane protein (DUF373 family)
MIRHLGQFERFIVITLLILMIAVVFVSTIELLIVICQQLYKPPRMLLNIEEMHEVFGFFLMVLIGLELLETIKAYLQKDKVQVEVVLLVALIAVSRKIIILEYKSLTPEMILCMAGLILSLAAGYFMVKRALQSGPGLPSNHKDN